MTVSFKKAISPVDPEELSGFEQRMGGRLPEDYREFLLSRNGGRVYDNDLATPEGEEIGIAVRSFFSIGDTGEDAIEECLAVYSGRYPGGLLPIAEAAGGNLIMLQIDRPGEGKVYFWDHETEADEEVQPFWGNLTYVASSFSDFQRSLVPYVDE